MPHGWQWDETLFQGSAPYYERGRLPYAPGLADALEQALALDGRGTLLDVGCGPGTVLLRLAHLFADAVGLDADAAMLAAGRSRAAALGIGNVRWLHARAEELPAGLGPLRVATFARSFHWLDRERVATAIFAMLEDGGAFVQIDDPALHIAADDDRTLPHPRPPVAAMEALVRDYLGSVRRAGQGVLAYGTPGGEATVLAQAGFGAPESIELPGPPFVRRSSDDIVAARFSNSSSAPHLFGDRLPAFERDLRALLAAASPSSLFAEPSGDTRVRIWRKP